MKQQDSPTPSSAGEEEDFTESSGSLLELVQPELKSLAVGNFKFNLKQKRLFSNCFERIIHSVLKTSK